MQPVNIFITHNSITKLCLRHNTSQNNEQRTIWENSFSENVMLNFPENAKKHPPQNDANCPKSKTRLIFTFF